jgi:hypothetical protein
LTYGGTHHCKFNQSLNLKKMAKLFKVVSSTTQKNQNSNGVNQRLEIQAYETKSLPLDQAPIDTVTRVNLMLAGINTWDVTVPISQSATRRLFGGMINTEGAKMKDNILFNKLNTGDVVAGDIVRFDTTAYMIGDNSVSHITTFVFEGEDAVSVANRQLGQHGACVIIDGKATASSEQMARRMDSASPESREARASKIAELLAKATVPAQQDAVAPVENDDKPNE